MFNFIITSLKSAFVFAKKEFLDLIDYKSDYFNMINSDSLIEFMGYLVSLVCSFSCFFCCIVSLIALVFLLSFYLTTIIIF